MKSAEEIRKLVDDAKLVRDKQCGRERLGMGPCPNCEHSRDIAGTIWQTGRWVLGEVDLPGTIAEVFARADKARGAGADPTPGPATEPAAPSYMPTDQDRIRVDGWKMHVLTHPLFKGAAIGVDLKMAEGPNRCIFFPPETAAQFIVDFTMTGMKGEAI